MNGKQYIKRLLTATLCLILVVTAQTPLLFAADEVAGQEITENASSKKTSASLANASKNDAYKEQISDLNSKIDALKKEQKAIQSEIDKTKNDKSKKEKEKNQLQNQVYLAQQEITMLSQRIGSLESNISDKEQEIAEKQAQIDENYSLFKQRLRAMYMNDTATPLGVVMGANTYADFLTGTEMVRRSSSHDQNLIENLVQAKKDIEAALAEIEQDKAIVESDKAEMAAQKQSLAIKVEQTKQQLQDINQLQREFEAQKSQKQKEEKEAQSEIDRIYKENTSIGDYVGGEFLWPVTGFTKISSAFGWRFGGTDYHTGIDLAGAGIYQKAIRAANSGKVIYASNSYVAGRGYGRYIIIDHGGGYSTLYGHSDNVLVQPGQYVERGETIGLVGTTGWSTGPHLHFEIRVNGVANNPMNWFH